MNHCINEMLKSMFSFLIKKMHLSVILGKHVVLALNSTMHLNAVNVLSYQVGDNGLRGVAMYT